MNAKPSDTPELHVGTEHSGPSGVWVLCSCGLSTNRQPAKLARLAWNVHTEHALAALREAVRTAYAVLPDTGSSDEPARVLPTVTVESVTPDQRDEVFELARATSGVWRKHPTGGVFTDVEWADRTWYVRLYDGGAGAVGYTPFFGVRSELRLTPYQVAQLQGQTGR